MGITFGVAEEVGLGVSAEVVERSACMAVPAVSRGWSERLSAMFATEGAFNEEMAHARLAELEAEHPEWFARFDAVMSHPLSFEVQDIRDAMGAAPDCFLRGLLYGALVMVTQISEITGRS